MGLCVLTIQIDLSRSEQHAAIGAMASHEGMQKTLSARLAGFSLTAFAVPA